MKKSILSLVATLSFVFFILSNVAMGAAGPQTDITTIYLDVPTCRSITIKVTDLQLRLFRVDGQNVYKSSFYSTTEMPRKVELKTKGNGAIDLRTNKGYQWIAMIINGEIFSLPQPPAIPICTNECTSGKRQCAGKNACQVCGNYDPDPCLEWSSPFSCPFGQVCADGKCIVPSPIIPTSPLKFKVGEWRQMVTDYQEGDKWFSILVNPKQWEIKDVTVNNRDAGNVFGKRAENWLVNYNGIWEKGKFLCNGFVVELPKTPSYISFSFRPITNGFLEIHYIYGGNERREGEWLYEGESSILPGAPAKNNPPEGKGRLPGTWGGIKTK